MTSLQCSGKVSVSAFFHELTIAEILGLAGHHGVWFKVEIIFWNSRIFLP